MISKGKFIIFLIKLIAGVLDVWFSRKQFCPQVQKKVHGDLNHVLYTIIYEFFDIILDYRFIVGLMTILVSQISVLDFLNRNHTA